MSGVTKLDRIKNTIIRETAEEAMELPEEEKERKT